MRAAALLLIACIHEFAWQFIAAELQGAVRDVTQWFLICALCWVIGTYSRAAAVVAVCSAVGVMSSTTAICAAAWLVEGWPLVEGEDTCSQQLGLPMLLISALVALLAGVAVTNRKEQGK